MREGGIRPRATRDVRTPRDSASQVERATLGLRQMLLHGAFHPGQRIAEIPLSAKLGISRTPLRLAFERLEHEGLVKALPHSGFAAGEFSIADVWDALQTRGILEGASARLAAERMSNPASLEPLRKLNREMEEILSFEGEGFANYLKLNETFHLAIFDLASSRALRRAVEQIYAIPFVSPSGRIMLRRLHPRFNEIRVIAEEHHRALVDAIEHREGERADNLAREHARIARSPLEVALSNQNFLETIPGGYLVKVRGRERV